MQFWKIKNENIIVLWKYEKRGRPLYERVEFNRGFMVGKFNFKSNLIVDTS